MEVLAFLAVTAYAIRYRSQVGQPVDKSDSATVPTKSVEEPSAVTQNAIGSPVSLDPASAATEFLPEPPANPEQQALAPCDGCDASSLHTPGSTAPACLLDIMHAAPAIFDFLQTSDLTALASVSPKHRLQTCQHVTSLKTSSAYAATLLASTTWPSLRRLQLTEGPLFRGQGATSDRLHACHKPAAQMCYASLATALTSCFLKAMFTAAGKALWRSSILWDNACSSSQAINTGAVEALLAAELFQLQQLSIAGSLHSAVLHRVGQASWPCLQSLTLSHVGMTTASLQSIVSSSMPMLEALDLSGNMLDQHAVAVLHARSWPHLQDLNLASNSNLLHFFAWGQGLLSCLTWPQLKALNMSGCGLSASAAGPSAHHDDQQHAFLPQVKTASLAHSSFGLDADAVRVVVRSDLSQLTHLDLSGNKLNAAAVGALATGHWPHLVILNLSWVSSDADSMACLAQGQWPRLGVLQIHGNNVLLDALHELSNGAWPVLRCLELTVDVWYKYIRARSKCRQHPLHLCKVHPDTHQWAVQLSKEPKQMAKSLIAMPFWPWQELDQVILHRVKRSRAH